MINEIGLVIYTYEPLENRLDPLWDWFRLVEEWYGNPYKELSFSARNKKLGKIHTASSINRNKLYKRLIDNKSWNLLSMGTPNGVLSNFISDLPKGINATLKSVQQPKLGGESYRTPSYLSIIVDPMIFNDVNQINGFIDLGIKAWSIVNGIYGFIDINAGIPPSDNLVRNFACVVSNLIPIEYIQEFKEWQLILSKLNKRIWKVFWGNFISREHIQMIGGYDRMRKEDYYRPQQELLEISWNKGHQLLEGIAETVINLPNNGMFLSLSINPLDWLEEKTQNQQKILQNILGSISIPIYSKDNAR